MPPQPGMFALPYASTHKARAGRYPARQHPPQVQPTSNPHIHHKEKKRKDISGKVGKEIDRRDDGRNFAENISALHKERERVEEEWRKGRDRVRERLLEGIEERRRHPSLDIQSRIHITRKLRNKVGTSPPPTPLGLAALGITNGSTTPITTGPVTNPHSLSVDEIPSPFPFPLTSVTLTNGHHSTAGGGAGGNGSRRRAKVGSGQSTLGSGALGKSLAMLGQCKDIEIEADLFEIRRGTKRRRAAAVSSSKVS
ncbi:hypothetical protein EDC04DRAFT_2865925 [Pisolithus marmoratus]|nr:hypothetical protein EDC04DRAFT_2865925 [Pisolithus marmoratus]